jgi:phage baseplate assembly protein W
MPQYIGFNTQNACQPRSTNMQLNSSMNQSVSINGLNINGYGIPTGYGGIGNSLIPGKKFTLTDAQLVIRDFLNALNIPLGSKVGQPQIGTSLWSFLFEPNTSDVQVQMENELRRVASQDPRLALNFIKAFPQENGMLIEIQCSVVPFNNPQTLNVFFNQQTTVAAPV